MKHLFDCWNKLAKEFDGKAIALFLDFDGTLAPIADAPDMAVIPTYIKQLLGKISRQDDFRLAIISGRALGGIKRMLGIKAIVYAGNHGLEIEGPKIKHTMFIHPGYQAILKKIKEELRGQIKDIKGAYLEDKGLTLTLHYRLVDKKDISLVEPLFYEAVSEPLAKNKIKITAGKMVLEVRPALDWDKGKVVLWLFARWKFALKSKDMIPVYVGDDATDEDAFKALKNKGLTVFVGRPKKSYAQYYLKDTKEVAKFLNDMLSYKNKGYYAGINKSKRAV